MGWGNSVVGWVRKGLFEGVTFQQNIEGVKPWQTGGGKWQAEGTAILKLEEFIMLKRKHVLELDNSDGCTSL